MPLSIPDIVTLADYVKLVLEETATDSDEVPTEVKRAWELTHDMSTVSGRKIDVYGTGYADQAPITRKEGFFDVTISVVMLERYVGELQETDVSGVIPYVPPAWVDGRIAFVEQRIFNPLGSVTESTFPNVDNPFRIGQWWTETIVVTVMVDPDMLRQHKVFWSEVEATFRRVK
jgi:hypothetical protein